MTTFEEYTAACEVFEKAHSKVNSLITAIKTAGQSLEFKWFNSVISEDQVAVPSASPSRYFQITKETWPSVDEISKAITAAQQAIEKVKELHKSLPESQRKHVHLPDVILRLYT